MMHSLINWNLVHELSSFQKPSHSNLNKNQHWSKSAPMYNFMSQMEKDYTENQIKELTLDKEDTVLDIGSGIGRLSIPISKIVSSVTCLDVSDGMLEYCKKNAQKEKRKNICFQKLDWETAEIGKDIQTHDIAIASRSVGSRDIFKLNSVAQKYAFILSFSQYPSLRDVSAEILDGISKDPVHRIPRPKRPIRSLGYNLTFNLLYDMGIDPFVKVIDDGFERKYNSQEEAYNDLRILTKETIPDGRLTTEQEMVFRRNVDLHLKRDSQKNWFFSRRTKTYIIGWRTVDLPNSEKYEFYIT